MASPISRQQLTQAVQRLAHDADDERAWQVLFSASWPSAIATTHRLLRGHRDLAEDAAQEAYKRIVRYADFRGIADGDAFLAYLRTVCRNVVLDMTSQLMKRQHVSLDESAELLTRDDEERGARPQYAPELQLTSDDLQKKLRTALSSEEQRLLDQLVGERSVRDIAADLKISYSNAGVRIYRLRAKIRKYLQDSTL